MLNYGYQRVFINILVCERTHIPPAGNLLAGASRWPVDGESVARLQRNHPFRVGVEQNNGDIPPGKLT